MTPQHTQTPWYCEGDAIYDNPECTGNPIAHVLSCAYGADDNAVDARRIVACVNACAGLPTETLETVPGYKAAIEGFHEQRDARLAAEAQRDQLRAMSVENILVDVVPGHDGMGHEVYAKSVDDVYAVLSKLSGEVDELEIQRDQLLVAMRQILDASDTAMRDGDFARDVAKAAIAAVKGEYIQHAGHATRKVGVTFIIPPGMSADELKDSILRMEGDAQ